MNPIHIVPEVIQRISVRLGCMKIMLKYL